jgi:hypothetical protein
MTAAEPATPAPFDYNAPLPDLHITATRSWEPAARRYRDLTEDERGAV